MQQAEIIRSEDNGIQTVGKFYYDGFSCDTLERPYLLNQHGISSISTGKYLCKKVPATHKIPYTHISITNVPNRDGICIHTSNYMAQLEGCIAVGMGWYDINQDGQKDVLNSKATFARLMAVLPDEFNLIIS